MDHLVGRDAPALSEQREKVVGVGGNRCGPAPVLVAAGQDRGHRSGREVGDGGRVAEPDSVPRQAGEPRVAACVELPPRVEQRQCRELVEDDHDDGRIGPRPAEIGAVVGQHQVTARRAEQEKADEQERRRAEDHQHEADGLEADRGERKPSACRQRERHGDLAAQLRLLLYHVCGEDGSEGAEEGP
jgi:hypothetical protein